MVKITFKNVGQGDSVLLEWSVDGADKVAVIDCNIHEGTNPILEYIKEKNYKEIEFFLLSHPHMDHFSGFHELLMYCKTHEIKMKKFVHTSEVSFDFLKTASRSVVAANHLQSLFVLLRELRNDELISVHRIDDNPDIKVPLGEEFVMEFLSPSSLETDKYIQGEKFPFDEEVSSASPNANWLCTVLRIYNDKCTFLLTADCESTVLTRIGKKTGGRIHNDKLVLCQVPHHGSKGNLNKKFWTQRKRSKITPAVISVGENGYGHPSKDVVTFFSSVGNFEIYSTNKCGALKQEGEQAANVSSKLNVFSRLVCPTTAVGKGDVVFELTGTSCKAS